MSEQIKMEALIQLNILNRGFTNHGTESATIDTRNDSPNYRASIINKLTIDGNEAVIAPNPGGELSLAEYINSVAENYDDMANEAIADFKEFAKKI